MTTRVFRRVLPWLLLLVTVLALAEDEKIRLAVMGMEDQSGLFKPKTLEAATDLLRGLLTKSEKFIVIDKGQQEKELRKMYATQKKETYRECYEQSCQIELGQALSADTLLRTKISKLGKVCALNSEMIDLAKEAGVKSGVSEFNCTEDGLLDAIKDVVAQLTGVSGSRSSVSEPEVSRPRSSGGPKVRKEKVTQARSSLVIKATPEEAVITVTGPKGFRKTVRGRFNEESLEPGVYTIIVESEGYESEEREVRLEADDAKGEKFSLLTPGNLEISGEPRGAKVEVSGPKNFKDEGGLPMVIEGAYRGEYKIKVSREGYGTMEREAEVKPGETTRVEVKLQKGASEEGIQWVHSDPANVFFTKSEITVSQYQACAKSGKCAEPSVGTSCNWNVKSRENHPINCVPWTQASAFCSWIGGRLPTEAEWEAEGSNNGSRRYPWGNQGVNCEYAIMQDRGEGCGRESTWPVCSRPMGNSVSGLCDMIGSVWEYTNTITQSGHRIKGGGWSDANLDWLTVEKDGANWDEGGSHLGFRCVKTGMFKITPVEE